MTADNSSSWKWWRLLGLWCICFLWILTRPWQISARTKMKARISVKNTTQQSFFGVSGIKKSTAQCVILSFWVSGFGFFLLLSTLLVAFLEQSWQMAYKKPSKPPRRFLIVGNRGFPRMKHNHSKTQNPKIRTKTKKHMYNFYAKADGNQGQRKT